MRIGFTGTQQGMTDNQLSMVKKMLQDFKPEQLHHGDCIGADEQAHLMANIFDISVTIHPPTDTKKRAFCPAYDLMLPAKPYLERNHDIVDVTDLLIAAPKSSTEELRSGTWATIRYAKKKYKHINIVYPNGVVEYWSRVGSLRR